MPLVTLAADTDYLKRIDQVVANASQGLTSTELDRAVDSATDDVWASLYQIGFNPSGWAAESDIPHNVVEIVRMLASARIWDRMLKLFSSEVTFEETYGAYLLQKANESLEAIERRRLLLVPSTRAKITPSNASEGKGAPKVRISSVKYYPNSEIIPDEDIDEFIRSHGPNIYTRTQEDDFTSL